MSKRKTTEEFIEQAIKKHENRYDYSLVDYKTNSKNITIICPVHGNFEQRPSHHLHGSGCNFCYGTRKYSNDEFIDKLKKVHNDNYDYGLVNYDGAFSLIKIRCIKHDYIFTQKANNHLNGQGCPICGGTKKLSTKDFIKQAIETHCDKYDYSLTRYINNTTKVKIICKKHGEFHQRPYNHKKGEGCPICNTSKGELFIDKFLKENNIKYNRQYKFKNCKHKHVLKFDFYLPTYNTCIEYDGEYHFIPHWGDKDGLQFDLNKIRDKIKNDYCEKNTIKLIRIRYDDDDETVINKLNSVFIKTKK
jgi:hypothetical protein